jgi:pimeloyl-ACP methyl ester carboxylesterase
MTELDSVRLSCHAVQHLICEIWSGYFGREVSPYDDFFDLGGDSLAMIDVVVAARGYGLPLRSSVALRNPSPARLAESLTVGAASVVEVPALLADSPIVAAEPLVEAVTDGVGEALYVVHSDSHVQAERAAIAAWGTERPVRAFRLLAGNTAAQFVTAVRREQSAGPYRLAGFGQGAVVAYEMACQLKDVALLALVKPAGGPAADPDRLLLERIRAIAARFGLGGGESVEQIHAEMRAGGWYDDTVQPADLPARQRNWAALEAAARGYRYPGLNVPTLLFDDVLDADGPTEQALRAAATDLEILRLDYGLESPHAVIGDPMVARAMRKALAA